MLKQLSWKRKRQSSSHFELISQLPSNPRGWRVLKRAIHVFFKRITSAFSQLLNLLSAMKYIRTSQYRSPR
jgi:hypothetical protein